MLLRQGYRYRFQRFIADTVGLVEKCKVSDKEYRK